MGHRALVAYERTDGQYTLHYSHWGAADLKLKYRITAETPFGGEGTDSKWAKQLLAELADGLETDAVDGYLAGEDRPSTVVEPKPAPLASHSTRSSATTSTTSTTRRSSLCRRRSR